MLLDRFLPRYQFNERHELVVRASTPRAFRALLELDLRHAPLVSLLLSLRELPWRLRSGDFQGPGLGATLEDLLAAGFILLAHDAPHELVLGLVGRFWRPNPDLQRLPPGEFQPFQRHGFAKVAVNLTAEPLLGGRSLLCTETRIQCLDLPAKRSFRRYWTLIRPFSGLIRRRWLEMARRQAESPRRGRGRSDYLA